VTEGSKCSATKRARSIDAFGMLGRMAFDADKNDSRGSWKNGPRKRGMGGGGGGYGPMGGWKNSKKRFKSYKTGLTKI
jgi:hypothetical protein